MTRRLISGGLVVTGDPVLGDLQGDVLVEDDRIVAVGPVLDPGDAEVIDASRCIVMPGFVNAHMHTWQTALRGVSADWAIAEYMRKMHAGLGAFFSPDDLRIATLVGALNQINNGATTLVDWCHNNPTPDHTDAAIESLAESGIRAVFAHGSPKRDPKPGEPHFSEIPHPRAEVERLMRGALGADGGLLGLALAILGPQYATLDVSRHDVLLARAYDLVATMHVGGGEPIAPGGFPILAAEGLISARVNIVHGQNLTDDEMRILVANGATFSVTPEVELQLGHGAPITGRLREHGIDPSLGVDLESLASGDMFTVMRMALQHQRFADHADHRHRTGAARPSLAVSTRDAFRWATLSGARMLGLDHRIGSLSPGKQADIVLLRLGLNVLPVWDPVATIVSQAGLANVDTVMIAGRILKQDGVLVRGDLDRLEERLTRSGARILEDARRAGVPV